MIGNGSVTLTIKGEEHHLKYGVQALTAFSIRQGKNTMPAGSVEGNLKDITDLFFCGMYGYSMRMDIDIIPYDKCMDLFEDFTLENNFDDQVRKMMKCYEDSIVKIGEAKASQELSGDKKKAKK